MVRQSFGDVVVRNLTTDAIDCEGVSAVFVIEKGRLVAADWAEHDDGGVRVVDVWKCAVPFDSIPS